MVERAATSQPDQQGRPTRPPDPEQLLNDPFYSLPSPPRTDGFSGAPASTDLMGDTGRSDL